MWKQIVNNESKVTAIIKLVFASRAQTIFDLKMFFASMASGGEMDTAIRSETQKEKHALQIINRKQVN